MPSTDSEALERVRAFLRARGASEDEITEAEQRNVLDLLVADRLLVPAERRYTQSEVSAITGMDLALARRFWRALGFPDVELEERMFTDLDIEALVTLQSMMDLGVADVDTSLQFARVIGSSMARIAEAEVSPALRGLGIATGSGDTVEAADGFARVADHSLPAMARLLEFVWRRHVQAAVRRAMLLRSRGAAGALPVLAVGFADMVGFTTLSQQLSEQELAAVVARFEELAHDTVTGGGGRVVKMIGDEAMFVADSALDAARIGLALAEAYAGDELLSDVRVALAVGPVLVQDGDFYGPVVNLASRVVNMAAPGAVIVTDEFHRAVEALAPGAGPDAEFEFGLLRPRRVKDLGRIQLWVLHRPGTEPVALDRRLGGRWERLAEVLNDLDELRDKGERLIAGADTRVRSGRGPEGGDAEGPKLE
ncbi:MAG TPA: adenylate cyclase regulatory domain-containing protein [Acidimicrobiales bacterium]|nr:adenylate cyclase regulatory domain-containing protein [Acidimicrobiales bacterium]